MKGDKIKYREGYKYQLAESYALQLAIALLADIITDYITLTKDGLLTIFAGYAWDGCSGPTYDDKTNMRGGLVHDALYQLMRLGLLPESYREYADRTLKELCLEDGMCRLRAWYYFEGVDHFAAFAARKGSEPYPIKTAP